jgi:hypothetical protein
MGETEDAQVLVEVRAEGAAGNRRMEPQTWEQQRREAWAGKRAAWEASGAELVYTRFEGAWGLTQSAPHRVVGKTATRLYVGLEVFTPAAPESGRPRQEHGREEGGRTCALDRAALERDGGVWCGAQCETYYTRPYEETPSWGDDLRRVARTLRDRTDPEGRVEHRRRTDEVRPKPSVIRRTPHSHRRPRRRSPFWGRRLPLTSSGDRGGAHRFDSLPGRIHTATRTASDGRVTGQLPASGSAERRRSLWSRRHAWHEPDARRGRGPKRDRREPPLR